MTGLISVPASQKLAFQELAKLTDEAYLALRKCVLDGLISSEPSVFIEKTSKEVEHHTKLGGQILGTLVGLRAFIDRSSMAVGQAAAGVASDAHAKGYIPDGAVDILSHRLTELLDIPSVAISSKAYSLVAADAAPFSDVRIVSDVRPIFIGKENDFEFSGSVLVHHLIIEVEGETDNQHSSLTTSDLLKLKRTVERAIEKDNKIRGVLKGGPLGPLEGLPPADKET
jgi:hypothetical protein